MISATTNVSASTPTIARHSLELNTAPLIDKAELEFENEMLEQLSRDPIIEEEILGDNREVKMEKLTCIECGHTLLPTDCIEEGMCISCYNAAYDPNGECAYLDEHQYD